MIIFFFFGGGGAVGVGVGYIFLCLLTYNSNFRHVETKCLVPNTSNLQYYIVLSNSLDPERVRQ